jgi:hypothetical protein
MTNQFDLNKLNSFIESANNIISCDSECQRNKTIQELKNKLETAESNLTLAAPEFEIAKRNYYTYISGQSGYMELIEKELEEKADVFVKLFKDSYETEISKIKTQLDTYNGLLINFRNIVDLYKQYKKENKDLFEELKEETNDILTNDRKTYYENQQIDGLNSTYYYILCVIYYIIVGCFFVFSLIYPSTFNWKVRLFILIIFIILPFISTILLGKIIQLIYWLFGILPKNVYF